MKKGIIGTLAAAALVIGAAGVSNIQTYEGVRTTAYQDPVGIWTICYGHTGPEVKRGLRLSRTQCDTILMDDIRKHRNGLQRCLERPLNQNQSDAVVSFAFNVGVTNTCKSTLVRKINAGDMDGAAREFPKWRYVSTPRGPVALPGLIKRREAEQVLFLSRRAPRAPAAVFLETTS